MPKENEVLCNPRFPRVVVKGHRGCKQEGYIVTFDQMIDSKTSPFIPNWLDLEEFRLPVFVIGRKSACWLCRKIGHLSVTCLRKLLFTFRISSHVMRRKIKKRLP